MATPIKPTPFLTGSSSKKFNRILLAEKDVKVPLEEKHRIQNLVQQVLNKVKK
jgi:hypothetical protein